jgi:adenine-specific DNA-methyltransferase
MEALIEKTNSHSGITPSAFCELKAATYTENSSVAERKTKGQFFTPIAVARFMANLGEYRRKRLRVLDAGAGSGILSCAVCEAASKGKTVKEIEIVAYEDTPLLAGFLKETLGFAKKWLAMRGIELDYLVIEEDFVLDHSHGLWAKKPKPYDLAIGNPPYFKIAKADHRAISAARYVYGQPNIYALFMGVAAELLRKDGIMVFITPRSYAAGPYFKRFRKKYFDMMRPERVHLFGSRKDAFRKDEVLQENIILKARKEGVTSTIKISSSQGINDLNQSVSHAHPVSRILHSAGNDLIFRLPASDFDTAVIDTVEQWDGCLHKYGMKISTGPVVPFRAKTLILSEKHAGVASVPLIWMQNIKTMKVEWPVCGKNGKPKPQYIKANEESIRRKLLVEDQNVVLLRRFSAKEEHRRLVAAPLFKRQLDTELIGLENHVNYIYRPTGTLSQTEALGISALLNSSLLDNYFRVSNGNTQVSATEVRAMPLPAIEIIENIGQKVKQQDGALTHEQIDAMVLDVIRHK